MNRVAEFLRAILAPLTAVPLLVGCGGIAEKETPGYVSIEPIEYPEVTLSSAPSTGSLYAGNRSMSLFADVRAHEIGDIVSVVLIESTSAAKSADTDLDKGSDISITDPTIFGAPVTINGRYNLGSSLSSSSAFESEASSNQSNSLSGSIAVQVSRVLPNGNLVIQGEKWIQINQSTEFIRLTGIVRPMDVQVDNTVESFRVADARIEYEPSGPMATTNREGWLSRVFNVISPL
jgi:flagellar L-ring protein precursor FlgH